MTTSMHPVELIVSPVLTSQSSQWMTPWWEEVHFLFQTSWLAHLTGRTKSSFVVIPRLEKVLLWSESLQVLSSQVSAQPLELTFKSSRWMWMDRMLLFSYGTRLVKNGFEVSQELITGRLTESCFFMMSLTNKASWMSVAGWMTSRIRQVTATTFQWFLLVTRLIWGVKRLRKRGSVLFQPTKDSNLLRFVSLHFFCFNNYI